MEPIFRLHDVLAARPGEAFALADEADLLAPLTELVGPENARLVLRTVGAWGLRDLALAELAEDTGLPDALLRRLVAAREVGKLLARHKVPRVGDAAALATMLAPELASPGLRTAFAVALGASKEPIAGVAVGRMPPFRLEPRGLFRRLVQLRAESFAFVDIRWSGVEGEENAPPETFARRLATAGRIVDMPLSAYLVLDPQGPRAVPVPTDL